MKKLLAIIVLFSTLAFGESFAFGQSSVELIGGGLSYYFTRMPGYDTAPNRLTPNGQIAYDGYYGLSYVTSQGLTYTTISVFGGTNQVYDPTFGATVSYGIHNKNVYAGFIGGGYLENTANLTAAGLNPVTMGNPNSTLGFSPILGVELNFRFYIGEKAYLKLNNVISPSHLNQNVGIGFDL